MSLSIPLSWINCAGCGKPLSGATQNTDNTVICPKCLATNRLIIGIGGSGATTCAHGTGGNGKAAPFGG